MALVSIEQRDHFTRAHLVHESLVGSNHRPFWYFLDPLPAKRTFLFRFEAKWLLHPQYSEVVSSAWHTHARGSLMFSFLWRLKASKTHQSQWCRIVFHGASLRMQSIQHQLEDLYSKPFDVHNAALESLLMLELEELRQGDELHWKQQSRVQQLQEGDRNSKFFHMTTIQ